MALADFKLAVDWIQKLAGVVKKGKDLQRKEIEQLSDDLVVKPLDLARLFIAPDCQPYNPADHHEEDRLDAEFRRPAFSFIQNFICSPAANSDGRSQLFILSDAGMGKTSLLAMFKMAHIYGFWPAKLNCVALKLGPGTLDSLAQLKGAGNTVLLLDALDEDPTAMGRIEERLQELLSATARFARTLITCRTQFFPKGENDAFGRQDRVRLGSYTCPVVYVSLFSDEQVLAYLRKRFPPRWFRRVLLRDNPRIGEAQAVVDTMDSLRFRPMMLAYIDDFLKVGGIAAKNIYQVFQILVGAWLDREVNKKNAALKKKALFEACQILAREMTLAGKREIDVNALANLVEQHPPLQDLPDMSLEGRSLLNRKSDGNFRFAHYSIQEFFFVTQLAKMKKTGFKPTSLMLQFIRHADLRGAILRGADLSGVDLSKARLDGADLRGADLTRASLSWEGICTADLREARLQGATLTYRDGDGLNHASWIEPGFLLQSRDHDRLFVCSQDSKAYNLLAASLTTKTSKGNDHFEGCWVDKVPFDALNRFEISKPGWSQIWKQDQYGVWAEADLAGFRQRFRLILPGSFLMGSPDFEPERETHENQHRVHLTRGFWLADTACTQAIWKAVLGANPSQFRGDNRPVENVSWNDVIAFIRNLSITHTGLAPRLPTEAEWEYACRAGTATPFSTGTNLKTDQANFDGNRPYVRGVKGPSREKTLAVKDMTPNPWGLYQMHGNVCEWCADWYGEYEPGPALNPAGPKKGVFRILRGGSWDEDATYLRSAFRGQGGPPVQFNCIGFRLALDL